MPIIRGSVTFARFFVESAKERPKDLRRSFSAALRRDAFEPLNRDSDEERAVGWVELEDHDATELSPASFLFGEHLLATYRIDALRIPASVVKSELARWSKEFAESHARPARRTEQANQKQAIIRRLRKRAFISTRTVDVSWNLGTDEVSIWSASRKLGEDVQDAFEQTFGVLSRAKTPGVRVDRAKAEDLPPTAELFGAELAAEVASRG